MSKSVLLALILPLGLSLGCKPDTRYEEYKYPVMTLGQGSLEFGFTEWGNTGKRTVYLANEGQMTMGVKSIVIGDAAAGSAFEVSWDTASILCGDEVAPLPEDTGTEDTDTDTGAPDTGAPDTGTDDTGGDTGVEPEPKGPDGAIFLLEKGCKIPLVVSFTPNVTGDAWDAILIETSGTELTKEEKDEGAFLPKFLKDPVHTSQVVYLHGQSEFAQGSLVVGPRFFDFGFVHPTAAHDEDPAYISIKNVGDADISVLDVRLASTCASSYALKDVPPTLPYLLAGGVAGTYASVTFTPTDTRAARCQLLVKTDDPGTGTVAVSFTGNVGADAFNTPPTVFLRWPAVGHRYSTMRPLVLELNIFDVDQPADSLRCTVQSLVGGDSFSCNAYDESGHIFVEVPQDFLETGTDTLTISVQDGSGVKSYASVSLIINSEYPDDDDDGDGWSVYADPADCDDLNPNTYPAAAEVHDGADNDCDGVIDEGTDGGDDDLDGFTEAEGDCNDFSDQVYPGRTEGSTGDDLDNDCDGTIDEGTDRYDDDGDGYDELNGDCNDTKRTINPGAIEICDNDDNNCNGFEDDGCVENDSAPIIVGGVIRMAQSACHEGEVIQMDVKVFDADRDINTYDWSTDDPTGDSMGKFDTKYAQTVQFTAPEITSNKKNDGKVFTVYVITFDPIGNSDYAHGKIAVWDASTGIYDSFFKAIIEEKGCASTGGGSTGGLLVAGAALALAFRRRE